MYPDDTVWFKLYMEEPNLSMYAQQLVCNRFRLNHQSFLELLTDIHNSDLFTRWTNNDKCGSPPSNLAVILLGELCYLGRAWTLDDTEEANVISREVIRVFFNKFLYMVVLYYM